MTQVVAVHLGALLLEEPVVLVEEGLLGLVVGGVVEIQPRVEVGVVHAAQRRGTTRSPRIEADDVVLAEPQVRDHGGAVTRDEIDAGGPGATRIGEQDAAALAAGGDAHEPEIDGLARGVRPVEGHREGGALDAGGEEVLVLALLPFERAGEPVAGGASPAGTEKGDRREAGDGEETDGT